MKAKRSALMLFLLIMAGLLLGSALWAMLAPVLPEALAAGVTIGTTAAPWKIDLAFIELTIGIVLSVNPGSLIGVILAVLVFYKL